MHNALAAGRRDETDQPLVICDLGMPRDVDPAVSGLPGVWVVDMDRVQREPSARAAAADAEAARHLVAAEVATYLAGQRMAEVTPTVTALRQRAADVVEAELLRLDHRLPGLDSRPPRRGRPHRAAGRRQAAARAHRADQAAGQRTRRRQLRRGAARAVRARPDRCRRRRHCGRIARCANRFR